MKWKYDVICVHRFVFSIGDIRGSLPTLTEGKPRLIATEDVSQYSYVQQAEAHHFSCRWHDNHTLSEDTEHLHRWWWCVSVSLFLHTCLLQVTLSAVRFMRSSLQKALKRICRPPVKYRINQIYPNSDGIQISLAFHLCVCCQSQRSIVSLSQSFEHYGSLLNTFELIM